MNIKLDNISKIYDDADRKLRILEKLSYEFKTAKSYAVVGKSGIGKSTLLHLLAGIDLPTEGKIFYDQTEFSNLSQDKLSNFRLKNIGFIFQFHNLLNEFSAVENVYLPLLLDGIEESEAYQKAKDILTTFGLGNRLEHKPGQLSGGEQQRVAIARSLINNPNVLLADEPTGSLDLQTAEEISNLLLSLVKDRQITLITVTHNRELAERFDFVCEMQSGGGFKE